MGSDIMSQDENYLNLLGIFHHIVGAITNSKQHKKGNVVNAKI